MCSLRTLNRIDQRNASKQGAMRNTELSETENRVSRRSRYNLVNMKEGQANEIWKLFNDGNMRSMPILP